MGTYILDTAQCPIGWEPHSPVERILQNGKNLLMTHMGEAPYDRRMGINQAVYDKPLPYVKANMMGEMARVLSFEPEIRLIGVEMIQDKHGTVFVCKVEVEDDPIERTSF